MMNKKIVEGGTPALIKFLILVWVVNGPKVVGITVDF